MITTLDPRMSKQKEFCEYVGTKIDKEVLRFVHAAAALEEKSTQEFISDVANEAASKVLNRAPIKRRPPRPKKRGGE